MAQAHLHLDVLDQRPRASGRALPVGLTLAGAALFVVSFFAPWWSFWLYAPQYPDGLRLVISLGGMGGDVREIDLLNHYIGMRHLEDAAQLEVHYAGWGVAMVIVAAALFMLAAGRRWTWLVALPAVLFPIGFIADSLYWLHRFGRNLDPHAPLKIPGFTPQLFGNGKIGQFETFAQPAWGFWVAVAGAVVVIAATILRARACGRCEDAKTCGAVCPRLFVFPRRRG